MATLDMMAARLSIATSGTADCRFVRNPRGTPFVHRQSRRELDPDALGSSRKDQCPARAYLEHIPAIASFVEDDGELARRGHAGESAFARGKGKKAPNWNHRK